MVNADQTVVILWDAAAHTQHFIRKASFKSEAEDFGFLIPTPTQPKLDESGNAAFPFLQKLTEPETRKVRRPSGMNCGCSEEFKSADSVPAGAVLILEDKLVAGFRAVVLEADSSDALVDWLRENGFAFSPEVEAWAKPYVDAGWKITALKVAKAEEAKEDKNVAAAALRLTFQTDQPLFPYREPDSHDATKALGASQRLLRIYFIGEARYQGDLTKDVAWTGRVAWSGKLNSEDRRNALELLNLPENAGPAEWWLTEFEDNWPYRVAPADLNFTRAADQSAVKRPPIVEYVASDSSLDFMACAIFAVVIVPHLFRRARLRRKQ